MTVSRSLSVSGCWRKKEELKAYVEQGGVIVAVCGGYQLLGRYYKTAAAEIEGLDILNIYTEAGDTRLIGNVVLESEFLSQPIVGFENHAGRNLYRPAHNRWAKWCTDTATPARAARRASCIKM